MTDEAKTIIDALRHCAQIDGGCGDCNYYSNCRGGDWNAIERDAADLIERQSAEIEKLNAAKESKYLRTHDEIDRLEQENAGLRDQVYNLTLYLNEVMEITDGTGSIGVTVRLRLDEHHPGLPGYNPAILEVRHE